MIIDIAELNKEFGYILAAMVSAVLFSLYHPAVHAPAWNWAMFTYFFVAGCYLAGVYMMRGFGLAVGTHIFYNIIVNLLQASR